MTFFGTATPITAQIFSEVTFDSLTGTVILGTSADHFFVLHTIFRIVSLNVDLTKMRIFSNTTTTLSAILGTPVHYTKTFTEDKTITTPDRDSVKEIPINIQMKGNNVEPYINNRNYYVRRIV